MVSLGQWARKRGVSAIAWSVAFAMGADCAADDPAFSIDVRTVLTHDDGQWLWYHPRAAAIPGGGGVVMTIQKHLQKSDYYSGLHAMYSTDGGATWTEPELRPELDWTRESADVIEAVCDVTPGWHAPTARLIAIGVKVRYRDGEQIYDRPGSHAPAYAVYDPAAERWTPWQFMEMPEPEGRFYLTTPGCVQWLVEPDGTLLVPVYFSEGGDARYRSTVLRCRFDGETLAYLEHGDELSLEVQRGLVEPSLAKFEGKYYLTLRNDDAAYVTVSEDGQRWAPIRPWTFDDGAELGSYNTQQHWLTHSDGLYLVYTRRGANNDHIVRHRAPLFAGRVDIETLRVIRTTERVIIPEQGGELGNFGVCNVSPGESWVTVSEGVWSDDARARGATGRTQIGRILWRTPNALTGE